MGEVTKSKNESINTVLDQDAILHKVVSLSEMVRANKKMFQNLGILVILIITALTAYSMYKTDLAKEADAKLGIALIDYKNQLIDQSELKLTEIVEDYDGSSAADRANYYLATISMSKDLLEKAYDHFSRVGSSDPIFYSSALAGIGLYHEYKKSYQEAANFYIKAYNNEVRKDLKYSYYFSAAINFELSGDKEKAKTIFEELKDVKEFSKSALSELKFDALN